MDYGFWDDRIRGTLGYYQKKVDNLLYSDPVPTSSSFSSVYQNIGSLKNRGIEFDVRVDIIKNVQKDLTWNVDFNIARNRTTLEKLNSSDGYFGGGAYDYFNTEEIYQLNTMKDIQKWCEHKGCDYWEYVEECEGKEIPCQLDDINQDGIMDELCFITDIEKESSKLLCKKNSF